MRTSAHSPMDSDDSRLSSSTGVSDDSNEENADSGEHDRHDQEHLSKTSSSSSDHCSSEWCNEDRREPYHPQICFTATKQKQGNNADPFRVHGLMNTSGLLSV